MPANAFTDQSTAINEHELNRPPSPSIWIKIIVVLGALLLAMGGVIALLHPVMLVSPQDEINHATHIYAGYLASRNLALAAMLLLALALRNRNMLNTLLLLTAFIQLLDAAIDCAEARYAVAPGVFILGVVFLCAAAGLSGHPFWRLKAWK